MVDLNRNGKSSNKDDLGYKDDAQIAAFRRCSLDEHVKRLKSTSNKTRRAASSSHSTKPIHAPPTRRRSSLKTSSLSSSSDSSISTKKKKVAFCKQVSTTIIEYRDEKYNQTAWLSSEERADVKIKAKEDVKVMKHLKKHPEILESSSEMRKLYASISLRGLEAFISKKTRLALYLNQQRCIHEVLETQELFFESSLEVKAHMLAKVSAERSLASRERARELGQEDMSTILWYMRQSETTSGMRTDTSIPIHTRNQYGRSKSMPLMQEPMSTNSNMLRNERGKRRSLPAGSLYVSNLEAIGGSSGSGYHRNTSGSVC